MTDLTVMPTMDIAEDIDWLMADATRIRMQWPKVRSWPRVAVVGENDGKRRGDTRNRTALLKLNLAL